jgi:hypothetical protein
VLAQYADVVVQPQPSVLDVEGEASTNDLKVELEGDAFGKASSSTGNLELGKERKFSVSTDAERLSIEVDDDDNLPKLTVSSAAQKLSEGIISYPDGNGTKTERHFEGLLVVCGVDITVLDGEDVDLASVFRLANAMMVTEPVVDWKSSSRRGEQGSHLAVQNTHHRDLVPAVRQFSTRINQGKITDGDLERDSFFRLR